MRTATQAGANRNQTLTIKIKQNTPFVPSRTWKLTVDGTYVGAVLLPWNAEVDYAIDVILRKAHRRGLLDSLPDDPETIDVTFTPAMHSCYSPEMRKAMSYTQSV